jgi:hypothetical protein
MPTVSSMTIVSIAELCTAAQATRQESATLRVAVRDTRRDTLRLRAEAVMRRERLQADGWHGPWRRLAGTPYDGGSPDAR